MSACEISTKTATNINNKSKYQNKYESQTSMFSILFFVPLYFFNVFLIKIVGTVRNL